MKRTFAPLTALVAAFAFAAPLVVFPTQGTAKARVLYAGPVNGVVLARETKTGRTFQFTLPADVAATLKAGDAVDVDLGGMRVTAVKGATRTAQIREPDFGEPCCSVVAFAKDGAALHSMLNALSGSTAVNASQIDLKTLVANVSAISAIADPAEPVGGIALLRNNVSGAHHIVMLSGSGAMGTVGSAMSSPVSVDERVGFAMLRANNQSFTFPLYRPNTTEQGPWVLTPNPSLSGINGKLVTKFPAKTDSSARLIRVHTPGTTDQLAMAVLGEDQTLIEGEYDVQVLRVTVPKVPIKKGHETRLLIGALEFASRDQDLHYVFDAKGEKQLFYMIGYEVIAVPAGKYSLKAGTRVVPFEIKDGEVTTL